MCSIFCGTPTLYFFNLHNIISKYNYLMFNPSILFPTSHQFFSHPHLNFKNGFNNNVKRWLLIIKGVTYKLNLRIADTFLIYQESLTTLNSLSDIEPTHKPFPKVYSKSSCVYGPARLSQF